MYALEYLRGAKQTTRRTDNRLGVDPSGIRQCRLGSRRKGGTESLDLLLFEDLERGVGGTGGSTATGGSGADVCKACEDVLVFSENAPEESIGDCKESPSGFCG